MAAVEAKLGELAEKQQQVQEQLNSGAMERSRDSLLARVRLPRQVGLQQVLEPRGAAAERVGRQPSGEADDGARRDVVHRRGVVARPDREPPAIGRETRLGWGELQSSARSGRNSDRGRGCGCGCEGIFHPVPRVGLAKPGQQVPHRLWHTGFMNDEEPRVLRANHSLSVFLNM